MGKSRSRAYGELRSAIEDFGGSMEFVKEGYDGGAWKVILGIFEVTFISDKNGFPDLDKLYIAATERPQSHRDHTKDLVPNAIGKFFEKVYIEGGTSKTKV